MSYFVRPFCFFACFAAFLLMGLKAYSKESFCDNQGTLCFPLRECALSVQIKGGIAPSFWTHREQNYLVVPSLPAEPLIPAGRAPGFNNAFGMPWTVGGEIGYNFSCNIQFFLEGAYAFASGKKVLLKTDDGTVMHEKFNPFQSWAAYFGSRIYFGNGCLYKNLTFFTGFKAGYINFSKIHYTVTVNDEALIRFPLFMNSQGVSAGLQCGIDYILCANLSGQITAEAIFSQSPETHRIITLPGNFSQSPIKNILYGDTRTLITFPITLGLRYTF